MAKMISCAPNFSDGINIERIVILVSIENF